MDWRLTYIRVQIIVLMSATVSVSLMESKNHGLPKEKIPCSSSRETVRETISCPRNKGEWIMRAKEMKCHDHPQNCTSTDNFKYHCVLNVWGNATIELCAEERVIVGRKCTEFSHGGAFLQEHYENKCTVCPYLYNSSDIYLYQECFQFHSVLSIKRKDDNSTDENNVIQKEQPLNTLSLWIGIAAFVVVVFVVGCVSCWVYRSRSQNENTALRANGVLLEMDRKESRSIDTKERQQENISHAMLGPGGNYQHNHV